MTLMRTCTSLPTPQRSEASFKQLVLVFLNLVFIAAIFLCRATSKLSISRHSVTDFAGIRLWCHCIQAGSLVRGFGGWRGPARANLGHNHVDAFLGLCGPWLAWPLNRIVFHLFTIFFLFVHRLHPFHICCFLLPESIQMPVHSLQK